MDWLELSTDNCSVQATMEVVGHKWSLLILREMFNGVSRFEDIRKHLGISEAVLTRRLGHLLDEGVIQARSYRVDGQRPRHEYVPTDAGWDLFPVVIALLRWGDKHRAPAAGGSWTVRHRDCGEEVSAAVTCPAHPSASLGYRDTVTEAGPSAIPRSKSQASSM